MDSRRFRNLGRLLQGIIFECPTQADVERLFDERVCRAPKDQMEYLKFLKVDRPAFVFDREKRLLHGVLKVESPAELISQPHSSQPVVEIKLALSLRYAPLRECVFSPKIQLCYFCALEFHFELDMEETLEIMELFHESLERGGGLNKKSGLINGGASLAADQMYSTIHRAWERRKEMALANLAANSSLAESAGVGEPSATPQTVGERSDKGGGERGGGAVRSTSSDKDRDAAREPSRADDSARNEWRASPRNGHKTGNGASGGNGITMAPSPPPNTGMSDDSLKFSQIGTCGTDPSDSESMSNISGDIVPHRMFNNIVARRRSSSSQQSAGFGVGSLPVAFGRQSQDVRSGGDGTGTVVTQQMALCFGGQGGGASEGSPVGGAPNVQVVIQTRAEVSSQTNGGGVVRTDVGGGQLQGQREDDHVNFHRLTNEINFLKREVAKLDQEKESARKRTEDDRVLLRTQAELLRRMQTDADTSRRNTEDIVIARRREQEAHVAQHQTMQDEKKRLLKEIDRLSGLVETLTCTRSNESTRLQKENAQLNSTLQMLRSEMDLMWTKNDVLRKENQKLMDLVDDRAKLALANEELMLQNESLRQQLMGAELAAKTSYSSYLGNAISNAPSHPEVEAPHLPHYTSQGPEIHGAKPPHHLSQKEHGLSASSVGTTSGTPVENESGHSLHGTTQNGEPWEQEPVPEISVSDFPLSPCRSPHLFGASMEPVNLDSSHLALPSPLAISPPSLPSNIQDNQSNFGRAETPSLPVPMVDEFKDERLMATYQAEGAASCGHRDHVAQVSASVGGGTNYQSELGPKHAAEQAQYVDALAQHQPAVESQGYVPRSMPGSSEPCSNTRGEMMGKSKNSHKTPDGMERADLHFNGVVLPTPIVTKIPSIGQTSPKKSEQSSGGSHHQIPMLPAEGAENSDMYPPGVERVHTRSPPPQARSTIVLHEVNHVSNKSDSSSMPARYDSGPIACTSAAHTPIGAGVSQPCPDPADGRAATPPTAHISTTKSQFVVQTTPRSTSKSVEESTVPNSGVRISGQTCRMYILGGTNEEEIEMEASEMYDFERGSWRASPDCCLPSEAGPSSLATVSVGRRLYVVGGMSEECEGQGFFYLFRPDSGRWERLADLPTPRSAVGLVECDGKIVAVGGRTAESSLMVVEIYDPELNRWFEGPSLKHRRAYHSTVVCDGSIFAVGGMRDQQGLMKSAEHLDLRIGRWDSVGRMSRRRTALGCASNQQCIMAAGGVSCDDYGRDYCVLNSTEIFDPRVNMWFNGQPMLDSRAWFSLTYFGGAMYAVGGRRAIEGEANTGMEKFELGIEGRWCAVESPTRRAFHSCCVVEG